LREAQGVDRAAETRPHYYGVELFMLFTHVMMVQPFAVGSWWRPPPAREIQLLFLA
jgi:hypothetical protein